MSLMIADKLVVTMHYTLTSDDGEVLDSSEGQDPLSYLHGANNIVPGLEKELTGKVEGDIVKAKIPAAEGYGDKVPELIQQVERSAFKGMDKIEVGMTVGAQSPDGQVHPVMISAVEGDTITIDANHPLAGMDLNFDITVVNVREATEEELSHGHVHQPGGCGHDH
jgi:FKBP-type peptidyl-prolyl cis-trans isomerase SlyD